MKALTRRAHELLGLLGEPGQVVALDSCTIAKKWKVRESTVLSNVVELVHAGALVKVGRGYSSGVRIMARPEDYRVRMRGRTIKNVLNFPSEPRVNPQTLAARRAEIPGEHPTLTGRICGDPLPGRSALDRMRSA